VLQSAVTKWDTDSNGSSGNGNSGNGSSSNANNCNGIDTNGFAAKANETDAVRCRRLELMEVLSACTHHIRCIHFMKTVSNPCIISSQYPERRSNVVYKSNVLYASTTLLQCGQ
jgi:hypothetical protein